MYGYGIVLALLVWCCPAAAAEPAAARVLELKPGKTVPLQVITKELRAVTYELRAASPDIKFTVEDNDADNKPVEKSR